MPVVAYRSGTRNAKVAAKRKITQIDTASSDDGNSSSSIGSSEDELYSSSSAEDNEIPQKRQKQSNSSKIAKVRNTVSSEEEYNVEKILDMKVQAGKKYFFVKWLGWNEDANSWEPEENMEGAHEMMNEYLKQRNANRTNEIKPKTRVVVSKSGKREQVARESPKKTQSKSKQASSSTLNKGSWTCGIADNRSGITLFVFRTWVDESVQLLYLDIAQTCSHDEIYSIVLTEDLHGKDPKYFYGATKGVDGSKYCLVQFEGSECIDVVAPIKLLDKFPYVKSYYESQGHTDICLSA